MELNIPLHPGQLRVFKSKARFRTVAAGRRWGKTHVAAGFLLTEAAKASKKINGLRKSLKTMEAWYIAPTYDQGKDIMWGLIKEMAGDFVIKTWENDLKLMLANGRCIQIKGADRPDRLRGVGLSALVMDEYADMRPEVWEKILRPVLADVSGKALFIGTPKRKNHFYDLYLKSLNTPNYAAFHFHSEDNPYLPREEIEEARNTLPRDVFKQEWEASFESGGGMYFDYPIIEVDEAPQEGQIYIAIDLAGFYTEQQESKGTKSRDETAIAVVKVGRDGWTVLDIEHGRWDVRETSVRILRTCQKHRPTAVGIEKGIAKNAVMPYLQDQMRRLSVYFQVQELTHGGQDKTSRVVWALQGRMEHGRIKFKKGEYLKPLVEQLQDFPNARHDDMADALAYIDQIAKVFYLESPIHDYWEPLDEAVGL